MINECANLKSFNVEDMVADVVKKHGYTELNTPHEYHGVYFNTIEGLSIVKALFRKNDAQYYFKNIQQPLTFRELVRNGQTASQPFAPNAIVNILGIKFPCFVSDKSYLKLIPGFIKRIG